MKKLSKIAGAVILCAAMLFSFAAYAGGSGGANKVAGEDAFQTKISKTIGHGNKVYFAGPMFNQAEKEYNLKITKLLEEFGYQVFLPQRDGIEAAKLEGKTEEELIKMIFDLDAGQVRKADIIFMNIDGRVPDEGACVELGIAYGIGKRCYGFKTDSHSVEMGLDMNPMISGCMIKIFKNFDGDKMIEELKQYLSKHKL
ncbi:MAG: nucleoside 2-deoxyribosyltransferase [Acidaminococcaceae bacterium]|nr:nucleoside 2-deoxyribosyltransferase [Acidaminococcaceae bacterium]